MQTFEIKINNGQRIINVDVADSWQELTANQLLYIASNYRTWQFLRINDESLLVARAKLFAVLIVNKTTVELKEVLELLSKVNYEEQGINLLHITDFVFNKNDGYYNRFQKLKLNFFKHLYGPTDKLANISINEFSFTLKYYNLYNTTKDEQYLNLLIACLYRPKQKHWEQFGDIRKPFIPFTAEKYIKQIAKIDDAQKMAIYLFYSACMQLISKLYPAVFDKVVEEEKKPNAAKQTFTDTILRLSGGKFGSFNETKDANAHLVLKELNQLIIDSNNTPK